jgi:hypothetical protein
MEGLFKNSTTVYCLICRIVAEWKGKVEGLSLDLDNSQRETRNASSELFRIKSAYEEAVLQLEEVRRENRALSTEIKDIMDQITEGGRSIHEIDKIRYYRSFLFFCCCKTVIINPSNHGGKIQRVKSRGRPHHIL